MSDDDSTTIRLRNFFQCHDSLATEANKLSTERASLEQLVKEHATVSTLLETNRACLAGNTTFIKEQRNRIELVSNHWFYGTTAFQPQLWWRGGCEGKIQRAQHKLETAVRERPSLEEMVVTSRAEEVEARSKMQSQEACFQRAAEAAKEVKVMRQELVEQHPSVYLQELQHEVQVIEQQKEQINERIGALNGVGGMFRNVDLMFQSVESMLDESQRLFDKAKDAEQKVTNMTEQEPPSGATTQTNNMSDGCREVRSQHFDEHFDRVTYGPGGRIRVTNRPCPNGCGYVVTWQGTYCCQACISSGGSDGRHGPRCEKIPLSYQPGAQERWDRLQAQREEERKKAAELREKVEWNLRQAERKLHEGVHALQRATESLRLFHDRRMAQDNNILMPTPATQRACGCSSARCCSCQSTPSQMPQLRQFVHHYRLLLHQQESNLSELKAHADNEMQGLNQEAAKCRSQIATEKDRIFDALRLKVISGEATSPSNEPSQQEFIPTAYAVPMDDNSALCDSYAAS